MYGNVKAADAHLAAAEAVLGMSVQLTGGRLVLHWPQISETTLIQMA